MDIQESQCYEFSLSKEFSHCSGILFTTGPVLFSFIHCQFLVFFYCLVVVTTVPL